MTKEQVLAHYNVNDNHSTPLTVFDAETLDKICSYSDSSCKTCSPISKVYWFMDQYLSMSEWWRNFTKSEPRWADMYLSAKKQIWHHHA